MNTDARTNLFSLAKVDSNEELDMACGAGRYLSRYSGRTPPADTHLPPNKSLNLEAANANLDFFADSPYSPNWESPRTSWDYRLFLSFRGGFEWNLYREVERLYKFREVVGYFPKKFSMSREERDALDKEIQLYAKYGMKITLPEQDPLFDPWKEAFRRVWYTRPKRKLDEDNDYVSAVAAYKKVISGVYSLHDIQNQ